MKAAVACCRVPMCCCLYGTAQQLRHGTKANRAPQSKHQRRAPRAGRSSCKCAADAGYACGGEWGRARLAALQEAEPGVVQHAAGRRPEPVGGAAQRGQRGARLARAQRARRLRAGAAAEEIAQAAQVRPRGRPGGVQLLRARAPTVAPRQTCLARRVWHGGAPPTKAAARLPGGHLKACTQQPRLQAGTVAGKHRPTHHHGGAWLQDTHTALTQH